MSELEKSIAALRQAVQLAPDNLPLCMHFGKLLIDNLRYDEAEQHYRSILARHPHEASLQLALADVFYRQNKNSHALAIVETLVKGNAPYPPALLLYSRLMYRAGEVSTAVASYKQAVDLDEQCEDPEFASLLGIRSWAAEPQRAIADDEHDEEDDDEDDEDEIIDGMMRMHTDEGGASGEVPLERPRIDFSDVGGMQKLKEEIQLKIIFPIAHAEMYAAYGKKMGGGILMYGPPGCGKTFLARATAGEIQSSFLSIGINDVLDMWIGNSERNLHSLFEQARRSRPCVLFFDEVDALGASRSDMRQSGARHLVNQFLAEMDGVNSSNEGVLILGATNAPWHVDSAFRRPGRFDRVLFVPPPDETARKEILALLLKGKPQDHVELDKVAAKTHEFSGADLKAVIDFAVEDKLREVIRSGRPTPLSTKDLLAAAKAVRPTTREWFATARNHALYANQGGIYDDILEYMKLK